MQKKKKKKNCAEGKGVDYTKSSQDATRRAKKGQLVFKASHVTTASLSPPDGMLRCDSVKVKAVMISKTFLVKTQKATRT
jgi:hypothetical protein